MTGEPADLFDAICRLDNLADWLAPDYPEESRDVRDAALALKAYVVLRLAEPSV